MDVFGLFVPGSGESVDVLLALFCVQPVIQFCPVLDFSQSYLLLSFELVLPVKIFVLKGEGTSPLLVSVLLSSYSLLYFIGPPPRLLIDSLAAWLSLA
jgi:hypothetical protein